MMLLYMSLHNSFKTEAEFSSSSLFLFFKVQRSIIVSFLENPLMCFVRECAVNVHSYTSSMRDAHWVIVLGTVC